MAKRKSVFGVANYVKRTPKKRPGRHTKRLNKRKPYRKPYKGQGRQFRIILMFEKVTVITLLFLTTLGDIKMESFEVVSPTFAQTLSNITFVSYLQATTSN